MLTAEDYRNGARRNLEDALHLREKNRWVGCVYLSGRAVECILRCLHCLESLQLDTGHDLGALLKRVREFGMLTDHDEKLVNDVNNVAVVWDNNLRYAGEQWFDRRLARLKPNRRIRGMRIKGDPQKANALSILRSSEAIIDRGEIIWKRSKKN